VRTSSARIRDALAATGRPLLAIAVALAIVAAVLASLGYAPGPALAALARGAVGSPAAWTATMLKATPLLFTGLAVAICFRAGVWNIGAEGQLLAGALFATAVATRWLPDAPPAVVLPAVIVVGALGGALFGSIAGALRAGRGVSEVISTILLNFVAIQLVALAVHGPLQEAAGAYPKSDAFPVAALLPSAGRLHLGVLGAGILALAAQWLVFRTAFGYRLRAVGHSARAARFAGISPERTSFAALAVAGGFAGLAGAVEVSGVTGQLYEGISPGHGYTAIAVALVARLHPLAVVPSAFFFGGLEAGAGAMQRTAGVPAVVTQIVQGTTILLSAAFAFAPTRRRASEPPEADAIDEIGEGEEMA
jgi:simple sugar transport system permease protein